MHAFSFQEGEGSVAGSHGDNESAASLEASLEAACGTTTSDVGETQEPFDWQAALEDEGNKHKQNDLRDMQV